MPIYPYMMPLAVGGECPEPVLIDKTIITNGTYDAQDDSADGYSQVTVNVPPTLFRSLVDGSITSVTAEDLVGVTSIRSGAFINCYELTNITLPNTVTAIYIDAFRYDSNLEKIDIPDSVTLVDNAAFMQCSGMKTVSMGTGVNNIAGYAFAQGHRLTRVSIRAINPPVLSSNVFYQTNNCPIYVPYASIDTYKGATNWAEYASRIFPLVATVADLANIDTTTYTKACVIGVDESYKEYTYDGSQWNEVT